MKILRTLPTFILSLLVFILEMLVVVWGGLFIYGNTSIPEGVTVDYVKGVWEPMAPFIFLTDVDRVKATGINTISIGPYTPNRLMSFLMKPLMAAVVKRAHQKGLAVHLAPVSWGPGFSADDPHLQMEEQLTKTAIEWAQFSEKYHVDFYSPQNEPDVVLGIEGVEGWVKEILPKVKEHYKGTLVLKLGTMMTEPDLETYRVRFATWGEYDPNRIVYLFFPESIGWDYLMVDIFPPDEMDRPEYFPEDLGRYLDAARDWADKQGNKGVMVGEFAYPRGKPEFLEIGEIMPGPLVTPEEQAQRTAEYLEVAMPRVEGIIYCGWVLPGYSLKGYPVEETVRNQFEEYSKL